MATGATGGDAGVVHGCTTKTASALMASLASGSGSNMTAGFTLSR